MKRAALARKSPLRRSRPMKRKSPRRVAKRKGDREYLEAVHRLPCIVRLEINPGPCLGVIEANHAGPKPGVGLKCSDRETVPMCHFHHQDWTDHTGVFYLWTKSERAAVAARWIRETQAAVANHKETQ